MKRYFLRFVNSNMICENIEHTFCCFSTRRSAVAAAKRIKKHSADYGNARNIRVYDTKSPEGEPMKIIYQIE